MNYGVQFVWADGEREVYVDLVGFAWPTLHEAQEAFDDLEEVTEGDYLADLWIDDETRDTKRVSAETIEEISGVSIEDLKQVGNEGLERFNEIMANRRGPG